MNNRVEAIQKLIQKVEAEIDKCETMRELPVLSWVGSSRR